MVLADFLVRGVEDDGEAEELEAVVNAIVQPGRRCCISPNMTTGMLGGKCSL